MKKGDEILFYHSVDGKEVVGIARVKRESYPDPTTDDERWVVVDMEPVRALKAPVSLQTIKATASLDDIALLRQSRLSVVPLTAKEFRTIVRLGG
jgi:predicted RNA-binding protein with PUA-like domain